jgi:hypothetical protein
MTAQEQVINDIKQLPDHALQSLSVIIKEFALLFSETQPPPTPVYGSGKGKMWIADDFDAPLDELKEYME